MQLRVITRDGVKFVRTLKVGDHLLCEDGEYYPIKSLLVTSSFGKCLTLSTDAVYQINTRFRIKTEKGFKSPEIWDMVLYFDKSITPMVVSVTDIEHPVFFYDILIDKPMIAPEGFIFKCGEL